MASSLFWYEWRHRLRWVFRALLCIPILAVGYIASPYLADMVRALDRYRKPLELRSASPANTTTGEAPRTIVPPRERPLVFDPALPDHLPPPSLSSAERECLAAAVLKHAGGDTIEAQIAVAQVVMRRAAASPPPVDLCTFAQRHFNVEPPCQRAGCRAPAGTARWQHVKQTSRWQQAQWVADDVAAGRAWLRELAEATNFRSVDSPLPRSGDVTVIGRIGRLVFYRSAEDLMASVPAPVAPTARELPEHALAPSRTPEPTERTIVEEPAPPEWVPAKETATTLPGSNREETTKEARVEPTVATGSSATSKDSAPPAAPIASPPRQPNRPPRPAKAATATTGRTEKAEASRAALMRALESSR